MGDHREDRSVKLPLGALGILDRVVDVFLKKGKAHPGNEADQEAEKQVACSLGLDGHNGRDCRVDYVDVADRGCLGDARLLPLLEQEGVEFGVHLGVARQLSQVAFGGGQLAEHCLVAAQGLGNRALLLGQVLQGCLVNGSKLLLDFADLLLDGLHPRVSLGAVGEQRPLLHLQLGELGANGSHPGVGQPRSRGGVDLACPGRFA